MLINDYILWIFLSSVMLIIGVGCTGEGSRTTTDHEASVVQQAELITSQCRPLRSVLMQDKTGSGSKYRTPQLSVGDLDPLFALLRDCGGEVGVGLVDEQSNRTLVRLYVPEPQLSQLPVPPSDQGNPFKRGKALQEYQAAKQLYEQKQAQRRRDVDQRIAAFKTALAEKLKTKPDARRTDVWGAVNRAEYFLAEPEHGWRQPPLKVMVLISDALDNVRAPSVQLPLASSATVLLINGSPSLGALEPLEPLRFESIDAAVRFITQAE